MKNALVGERDGGVSLVLLSHFIKAVSVFCLSYSYHLAAQPKANWCVCVYLARSSQQSKHNFPNNITN